MQKTLTDRKMATKIKMKQHLNTICVMVKTYKDGPYTPLNVVIDLDDFIKAPSADIYIADLVSLSFMGSDNLTVSYNYTKDKAKEELKLLEEFKACH